MSSSDPPTASLFSSLSCSPQDTPSLKILCITRLLNEHGGDECVYAGKDTREGGKLQSGPSNVCHMRAGMLCRVCQADGWLATWTNNQRGGRWPGRINPISSEHLQNPLRRRHLLYGAATSPAAPNYKPRAVPYCLFLRPKRALGLPPLSVCLQSSWTHRIIHPTASMNEPYRNQTMRTGPGANSRWGGVWSGFCCTVRGTQYTLPSLHTHPLRREMTQPRFSRQGYHAPLGRYTLEGT